MDPISTSDKTTPVRIRMGEGMAALEPKTVIQSFDGICAKMGDSPALHQKVLSAGVSANDTPWTTWTWNDYRKNVDGFAKSLISIGFEKFDIVNIIGFNSPEWVFANFGAIMAGGISAGVYATNGPEACKYQAKHSGAKVIVVEGVKQLKKYYSISKDLPELKALVMYGPDSVPEEAKSLSVPVYSFAEFLDLGKPVYDNELKRRGESQKPNEVAALIYTSGTTGMPKAVMITQDNMTWTSRAQLSTMDTVDNNDHMISYLPLSHIAAQMLDLYCPLETGLQIWFAQPDALKGSLGATLKEVRPTIFFGVPRVWEKIYAKMQEVAKSSTGLKKMISTWAKGQATNHWNNNQYVEEKNPGCGESEFFYPLAEKLLGKVRVALGLDRCVACYVGAAPMEVKIIHYFASINIPIFDLFGASECTGPHSSNTKNAWKIGTCGRSLPGTVTKVADGSGELIFSGRHVFAGYMGMPEKTEEAIDQDGFYHTGDVVKIDDCLQEGGEEGTGFISITGRIKELIITAGGENVPPVLIEDAMKNAMPALSNCMVIGDKRKFLSILFCLQVEIDAETGIASNKLTGAALDTSKEIGSSAVTTTEAMTCDKWKKYLDDGMAEANGKAISRAQRVAKWAMLETDFTEPGGELTPTLKLKRSVAADKYNSVIEGIYN